MSLINIVALGGVQEIGKNLYVVDVDGQLFVLDAGLKYPSSDELGIDVVLPDFSYLINNGSKISGIFLSHAHDDHIAAVPEILKYLNVPVYGSPFTMSILKDELVEKGLDPNNYKLNLVQPGSSIRLGLCVVSFIQVSHSVPEALCITIKTKDGTIVYTGNFNFDQNGGDFYKTDIKSLCDLQNEKVLALMTESIGTTNLATRNSVIELDYTLRHIFDNAKGRIIMAIFSTNLQRIQQIINLCNHLNKRLAFRGRKAQEYVRTALRGGYLQDPEHRIVKLSYIDDKNTNEDKDLVFLVTGERDEPYTALINMAKRTDRLIHLNSEDTIVTVIRPSIGTEKIVSKTLDKVYRITSNVFPINPSIIPSTSSNTEEVKEMINIVKPKYILPVVGEYRHQYSVLRAAKEIGYKEENIYIPELGKVISFSEGECLGYRKDVPVGDIMLDGKGLGDVRDAVMRDREILAEDGVLMFVANINAKKRTVVTKPQIIARGLYISDEDKEEIMNIFKTVTDNIFSTKFVNWVDYKSSLKMEVQAFIAHKTKLHPLIIPAIISTEPVGEEEEQE